MGSWMMKVDGFVSGTLFQTNKNAYGASRKLITQRVQKSSSRIPFEHLK